jgi:hypothetical protein
MGDIINIKRTADDIKFQLQTIESSSAGARCEEGRLISLGGLSAG